MRVRITQIDGALPNLALMRLADWHRQRGHVVHVTRDLEPRDDEPTYDKVYGSAIFDFSAARIARFKAAFPDALVGGTGSGNPIKVEDVIGQHDGVDYSGWPDFDASIGFTQRGCRLKCKFCVVPEKEGRNRSVATIAEIYRGAPHPKKLHLLDNDFFGQDDWRARIDEIRTGGFRVCISQGINVRLIDDESAQALASIEYRDTKFGRRRLYTAWDNLHDERVFFRGVDTLQRAGVPPRHLMVYMLVGYDPLETWPQIWRRFNLMVERGIRPYPMVYRRDRADLRAFQRWVLRGLYRAVPFRDYEMSAEARARVTDWSQYPLSLV